MLTLALLMIGAGLMGATVNMAMSTEPRIEEPPPWERWRWSVIAGIGAALLVPLFLRTVSSGLLTQVLMPDPKGEDLLVFGGFCLLAAISSKKFIESLSEKLVRETREEAVKIRAEVEQVAQQAEKAELLATVAAETVAPAPNAKTAADAAASPVSGRGDVSGDPWKGAFGGVSEAGGRKLEATISPIDADSQLMTVHLRITSTNPGNPLQGAVRFYLHPTFPQNVRTITAKQGNAGLSVISYGAFTVGAETDGGKVRLELDLSTLPDAKEPWSSR